jgi:hypothetical protein
MRSIKGLVIVLIGMISMTAFATTSEPARKSKATFEQHDLVSVVANVVNVDPVSVRIVPTIVGPVVIRTNTDQLATKTEHKTVRTVDDVGWHINELFTNEELETCVDVYDLHGNPLNKKYKQLPRGAYILKSRCKCARSQRLVFKE